MHGLPSKTRAPTTAMRRQTPARRAFLKASGVAIALPQFISDRKAKADTGTSELPPRRLVCIGNEFGMYPEAFWPASQSEQYNLTPLLEPLRAHQKDFTLFRNLDHGLKGGHFAVHTFLTGVKASEARMMYQSRSKGGGACRCTDSFPIADHWIGNRSSWRLPHELDKNWNTCATHSRSTRTVSTTFPQRAGINQASHAIKT